MRGYHIIMRLAAALAAIFCTTATFAQPVNIKFDKTTHDFGDIILNSGKQTATFTFTNIGTAPVTIQHIISSCGCTTTNHTKSPVMPGKTGQITAVYSNDEGAYPFDKPLTVYVSGENRPVILRLRGVVHDKKKSLKELYPENFNGFAMRSPSVDLGDLTQGESRTDNISVANTSAKTISVSFTNLSGGLKISPNPLKIEANQKADISITVDTKGATNWGNTNYTASVSVDNNKVPSKNITVRARIRDNFAGLSKEEIDNGPLPMAVSSSFDAGTIKKGETISHTFEIRNIGEKDIVIHKIESSISGGSAANPKIIKTKSTGSIEVKVNTSSVEKGEFSDIFTLYTNSPKRPMVILIVTGTVN